MSEEKLSTNICETSDVCQSKDDTTCVILRLTNITSFTYICRKLFL